MHLRPSLMHVKVCLMMLGVGLHPSGQSLNKLYDINLPRLCTYVCNVCL